MSTKKQGQITAFIIIGIILLLITAVVLIMRSQVSVVSPQALLNPEVIPIYSFVQGCTEQLTESGARIIGANGGYIQIPPDVRFNPNSYLPTSPIVNARMPYWWYDGTSRIPTEDFVVSQLEGYVQDNLHGCLQNFSSFTNQFTIQAANATVQITLTDAGILSKVSMPTNITDNANKNFKISDFQANIPIRLKAAFDLATQIMNTENSGDFLEKFTVDLMSLDSDIPTTDVEFSCAPKTWLVGGVKKTLMDLLQANIPLIKVDRTVYAPTLPNQEYMLTHYTWPVTQSASDMIVGMTFDEKWPFQMEVRPSDGFTMRSNSMNGQQFLSWICVHLWHFTYDISYPVMVAIYDPAGSSHKDFTFTFPFKVSVNHNDPQRTNLATAVFNTPQAPESQAFCSQRLENDITVYTVNNVTQDWASDINVTYTCLRFMCDMGTSKYIQGTPIAILNGGPTKFPLCINGILRGSGNGYENSQQVESTEKQKSITLYMTPSKAMDSYDVVKYALTPTGEATATPRSLSSDDIATIDIKDTNSNFESFVISPNQTADLPPLKLLADKDNTYTVTIYLTRNDNLVGGYQGNWTVSWDDLSAANAVRFSVLEFPPGLSDDETASYLINMSALSALIPAPQLETK